MFVWQTESGERRNGRYRHSRPVSKSVHSARARLRMARVFYTRDTTMRIYVA